MNKEALLAQKAEELTKNLTEWATEEHVLGFGEKLVFSLQVQKVPFVERSRYDVRPEWISPQCLASYKGKFLKPAQLSAKEAEELIARMSRGQATEKLEEILVKNKNGRTRCWGTIQQKINRALTEPLNGKYYRLASGALDQSQLWEVDPP